MQTDVDGLRIQLAQQAASGGPRRPTDQAGNRVHAAQASELHGSRVDAGVQAEVVDADRDAARRAGGRWRMTAPEVHRQLAARRRAGWFIVVGCAAAVHLAVVVMLVRFAGVPPLAANIAGWLIAFGVSSAGHHSLSFRHHGAPVLGAARRFFIISAAGFAFNEAAYTLLLHWGGMRYDLGLAVVLIAVAAATHGLSRHWAFFRIQAP